jgi:hypothetical protein
VDVLSAFVLTALVTVYVGYEVGKGEMETGTGILVLVIAVAVIVIGAGLVYPNPKGEPIQSTVATVLANYGAFGLGGLVIGGVVGYYFGDKEKSSARS